MHFEFRTTGDYDKVCRILRQSVKNVDKIGHDLVESNSQIYKDALIENIEYQKLSFKPLTPDYVASKGILGLDTRVLIATGEYINSIDIREMPESGGKLRYRVGVDPGATHSNGISMGLLAMVMEYGTADGRIPARPHYGPTWQEVRAKIRNNSLKFGREIWQMR